LEIICVLLGLNVFYRVKMCYLIPVLITTKENVQMELANVSNRQLTARINEMLGKEYSEAYICQVKGGKEGSAALRKVVRDEVRNMLMETLENFDANPRANKPLHPAQ
jgi:hypothetical protein